MKTRKRKLRELCSCSPDVGDCNKCIKGFLKPKYLKKTKRFVSKLVKR